MVYVSTNLILRKLLENWSNIDCIHNWGFIYILTSVQFPVMWAIIYGCKMAKVQVYGKGLSSRHRGVRDMAFETHVPKIWIHLIRPQNLITFQCMHEMRSGILRDSILYFSIIIYFLAAIDNPYKWRFYIMGNSFINGNIFQQPPCLITIEVHGDEPQDSGFGRWWSDFPIGCGNLGVPCEICCRPTILQKGTPCQGKPARRRACRGNLVSQVIHSRRSLVVRL